MILCRNVFARRCNKQSFPDCLAVLGFVLDLHVNNYRFHFFFQRSRFFGWKKFWVVLERGVLSYFSKRCKDCLMCTRMLAAYMILMTI